MIRMNSGLVLNHLVRTLVKPTRLMLHGACRPVKKPLRQLPDAVLDRHPASC